MKRFLLLFPLLLLVSAPERAFASYPLNTTSTAFSVTLTSPASGGQSLKTVYVSGTYDVSSVPAADTYICMIPYTDAASWKEGGNSHLVAGMGVDFTNVNFYFNPGFVCWPRPASNTGSFAYNLNNVSLGAHKVGILALGLVKSPKYCGASAANAPCYSIPDGDGQDFAPISYTVVATLPPASCTATTINNCSLPATTSGSSAGSCSPGYTGTCNYTCTKGAWSQNSNSCTPPATVNSAPAATISFPATNPYSSTSGTSIMFYGYGTDPDLGDYITDYEWRDGSCSAGATLSTSSIFTTNSLSIGSHTIYFRVKDSHAAWSTCVSTVVDITAVPAPTVAFGAYAITAYVGDAATLYWYATNATSCTASGDWSGAKDASQWTTETLSAYTTTGTYTYNLSCTGVGGTTTATPVTITVTDIPAPFVGLYVSPTPTITYASSLSASKGDTAELSWYSTNATSCVASESWSGTKNAGTVWPWGLWQEKVGPFTKAGTYSYVLTCTGAGGSSSGTATVTVKGAACAATTINNCRLSGTASGGTSGSCSAGYTVGSCSYSCTDGVWTQVSNTCALPAPTGSVTSNSCTISSGASSCAMNVEWTSSNTIGTVTVQRPYDGNSIFATGVSGNKAATFTPAGSYNLDLYDGTTKLATGTFTASCASKSTWNGSLCAPDPCPAQTITNCSLPATASGGSAGDCSTGYSGSCSYACSSGTWTLSSNSCQPSPTVTFSANPTTINQGQPSTLTWSSANTTSCTSYGGFSTGGSTANSVSVSPSATSNYQMYCVGPGGSVNSNIVEVIVLIPEVLIDASPTRVSRGGTTTVSTTAENVDSCTITKNGLSWQTFAGNPSGAVTKSYIDTDITTQTVYEVTCTNTGSSVTAMDKQIVNIVAGFSEF